MEASAASGAYDAAVSALSVRGLLFTDIEGSTALVHRLGDRFEDLLGRHHEIIRAAAAVRSGVEESREGDSLFITFPAATAAVACAVDAQRRIEQERWPADARVRVRMGVHVGEVTDTRAGLVGFAIHQAARVMSAGHGGQIVVSGDAVRQSVTPPANSSLRSLGVYHLRDIGEMELFQIDHPELQAEFPPLRTVRASAPLGVSNLPAAVSPIVGRQRELATLAASLLSDRLVTLTGVGGIGKTRLAVEVAARTVGRDAFGPFVVDLSPISDLALVPTSLAASLGVQVAANVDVMALVRSALADHPVMIVVDNCEHLLPGIAEFIGAVLVSNANVRVLATSRESLGVAGERVCGLDALPVPQLDASLHDIEGTDAGALFLARLPLQLTTRSLSSQEVEAIGTICRKLEGIPLGLELAAARCGTLPLIDLADRLMRSIAELAPVRHGAIRRHRTMHAALDWGYELLVSVRPGRAGSDEPVRRRLRSPGACRRLRRRRAVGC